jgi:hypothetical protein
MSRKQSSDERACRRLLKRALRTRNHTLMAVIVDELGHVLEEESEASSQPG